MMRRAVEAFWARDPVPAPLRPHAAPCSALKRHPDAELPVQLALRYLRLQRWWEGVQHRLPPKWAAAITAALFTVTGGEPRRGGAGGLAGWAVDGPPQPSWHGPHTVWACLQPPGHNMLCTHTPYHGTHG